MNDKLLRITKHFYLTEKFMEYDLDNSGDIGKSQISAR